MVAILQTKRPDRDVLLQSNGKVPIGNVVIVNEDIAGAMNILLECTQWLALAAAGQKQQNKTTTTTTTTTTTKKKKKTNQVCENNAQSTRHRLLLVLN